MAELIYRNDLASPADVEGFVMEGEAKVTFPEGRMRLENALDPALGQAANFVFWCPAVLPDCIRIEWRFRPLREPGLAMLFFAASGLAGEDLFDPALAPRSGEYGQYTHGDIRTLHLSYFRRRYEDERAFHTCNLRKSRGFHLVAQGADPIPDVEDCKEFYSLSLTKSGPDVAFAIDGLPILAWRDDGKSYGPVLGGGRIGFRQMAPLIAEYSELRVYQL